MSIRIRSVLALLTLLSICHFPTLPSRADEGLWTFDNPPLKQLKERYNFTPSTAWLEHVRLSSVRLNDGGSGSFVSAQGLVMTNHHVAESQMAKLSTPQRDLNEQGFYAPTLAEELRCPDLEINVLVALEDVTARVQAATAKAADLTQANDLRAAEIAKIEQQAQQKTGLRCDVITLYNGGEYWLYQFKKYTDIRLVFAPEAAFAFFGGDPDNFTYPRYDLDVAFLRVYENGQPLHTPHYLQWNPQGAQENELIFISGNPGNTERLKTVAQLRYLREVGNPQRLRSLKRRRAALLRYAAQGSEQQRQITALLAGVENGLKALTGYQEGLLDPKVFAEKEAAEKDLRQRIAANPDLQRQYGRAWDDLATAYQKMPLLNRRLAFSSFRSSPLATLASGIVRYTTELAKGNVPADSLDSVRFRLLSPAPIYPSLEEALLTEALQESLDELGKDDPFVQAALGNQTPAKVAQEVIRNTKLMAVDFRKSLLEAGLKAVESSTDPLLTLMRKLDPLRQQIEQAYDREIESLELTAGEQIGKARFAIYGKTTSPDATFSLRLSYGVVKGYELGTTYIPYKTTFHGLYDRVASFDGKAPFNLPERVLARKNRVKLETPLNFVCTADTIGGNSGSPIINRQAELVGILFDGNIQSLVWQYSFTEETGRSVGVHSAGIIEALRNIYDATPLVTEILTKK
jgi:hypothetical protein